MIKELVTRFGFEIDDHGLKQLSEGIEAVKEGVVHLAEAIAGEALGLYELVEHAAEAGVELKIMTQETGLAADKLQELQYRAKLADMTTQELNQSMFFLARNMAAAREGGTEAIRHFQKLGISLADIQNKSFSTDQALEKVAATFHKMKDGPEKAALAANLFGRAGARMIPFLNSLKDALDPVNESIMRMSMITEDQIEESEEFHANLETLKTGLNGIVRVIGFGLMPTVNEIIEQMKKWIVQNREVIVTNLTEFVKGMAAAMMVTLKIVDALIKAFAGLAHGIGGVRIATEALLVTFAVISGVSVLWGIGKVTQAVVLLGNELAIANLKAAAIPVLIGLAFVSLLLVMEDIYSFFQGKDSFFGDLMKAIPELGTAFQSIFGPIFQPFVNIVSLLTADFISWKDVFKEIGVLIINTLLTPLREATALVSSIMSLTGRALGNETLQKGAAGIQDFSDKYLQIGGGPGAHSYGGHDYGLDAPDNGPGEIYGPPSGGKTTQNQVQLHQEFNFPPGTEPGAVTDQIANHTTDGLDSILRQTSQSTTGGGAF